MRQVICLFVYIGKSLFTLEKNPRFTAFLKSNLHTRLVIITENELGLAFPPRNLPQKFRPDPSTFYLVIVVTNRQTDRQTNAGDSIIPRFRGDNDRVWSRNTPVLPPQRISRSTHLLAKSWLLVLGHQWQTICQKVIQLQAHITPMIRYDMRCYFNVPSKAHISQLNLLHRTKN